MQNPNAETSPLNRNIRRRYVADRILLLLLYKPSESDAKGPLLSRKDGTITLRVGWLARQLKMNPSKLYDQLLFLQDAGYLSLDRTAPWGLVRITCAKPLEK